MLASVAAYPRNVTEFERWFADDGACIEFLAGLRWPDGFACPSCEGRDAWVTKRGQRMCRGCGRQVSVKAGTVFHGARVPLTIWFRAAWWVVGQKQGANAMALQRLLGLGSYQTAWHLLHRLRHAMVRVERTRLSGTVEVDETLVGGFHKGKRGRDLSRKALVVIAAECRGDAIGRIRMRRALDSGAASLVGFVCESVEPGSTVITDGLATYRSLPKKGYSHDRRVQLGASCGPDEILPRVHRVASLLKRWLLGTHQGSVHRDHLDAYLDEFCFRFNRRTSRSRGLLFLRLMQNAVRVGPLHYEQLVSRTTHRGPKPQHKM